MSTQRILFLCYRIAKGYGVDAVVLNQARILESRGHQVFIACVEHDGQSHKISIHTLLPTQGVLNAYIDHINPTCIVAHTEPWMSLLATVPRGNYLKIIWEHGDPTPELLPQQLELRSLERSHKQINVYPKVDQVFAISEFIRSDIQWPNAIVAYNGLELLGEVKKTYVLNNNRALRVGTLMRLGHQEALYKGSDLYISLKNALSDGGIEFAIMGKGTDSDAKIYRDHGIQVLLNASHQEKIDYLRSLDIFISPSLWEGFNLPLVEAQTLGVVSLAFDVGAHPEVTPWIFSSTSEMATYIKNLANNRELLAKHAQIGHDFVKKKFSFESNVDQLEFFLSGKTSNLLPLKKLETRKLIILGFKESIQQKGILGFALWISKKILRKYLKRI